MAQFPTGYIPDIRDKRDKPIRMSMMSRVMPPPAYHGLAERMDRRENQLAESCVGFAAAHALYAAWRARGIDKLEFPSPLFIWSNARHAHGAQRLNSGTYIRLAMRRMRALGYCPNSAWDGLRGRDMMEFSSQPPLAAYRAANDQKLTDLQYYRIDAEGDAQRFDWMRSLSSNSPVVFGIPVSRSFMAYDGKGYLQSPSVFETMLGGHAMCALGYDEEGVYGPNSWPGWGDDGWFRMSWKFIEEWSMDKWAIVAPDYFSEAA